MLIFSYIFDGLISNWQINDDCDKFRLTRGRIGGIFITGIVGNFYTKQGGIFDFQNGNSRGGLAMNVPTKFEVRIYPFLR